MSAKITESQRSNPPPTMNEIIARASNGVRKVDTWGQRGCTMVNAQETEAMALLLVGLGLNPYPEAYPPKGDAK